jgi:hypothetical protein
MPKLSRVVFVFFIIVGCGTAPKGKGPVFSLNPAQDGMSTVYHYRIERGCGGGAAYTLISNGEVVAIIGNGGYFTQHLKPGMYEYEKILQQHGGPFLLGKAIDNAIAKAKPAYTITTESNETYFLRWDACFAKKIIEEVPQEIALKELKGLKAFESIK